MSRLLLFAFMALTVSFTTKAQAASCAQLCQSANKAYQANFGAFLKEYDRFGEMVGFTPEQLRTGSDDLHPNTPFQVILGSFARQSKAIGYDVTPVQAWKIWRICYPQVSAYSPQQPAKFSQLMAILWVAARVEGLKKQIFSCE